MGKELALGNIVVLRASGERQRERGRHIQGIKSKNGMGLGLALGSDDVGQNSRILICGTDIVLFRQTVVVKSRSSSDIRILQTRNLCFVEVAQIVERSARSDHGIRAKLVA